MKFILWFLLFLYMTNCYAEETKEPVEIGSDRKACPESRRIQPAGRIQTRERLADLRKEMSRPFRTLDAYIITSNDEHQSEMVSNYDRRLEYITGFSGSMGDAVVTSTKAALWVDGRYHLQADNELSCDWLLMRIGREGIPEISEWLRKELPNNAVVGADAKFISNDNWEILKNSFEFNSSKHHISLVDVRQNLIDLIWDNSTRPQKSKQKVYVWDLQYAGVPWQMKVEDVRREMRRNDAQGYVITALDEIAWLLNIRGNDIPYNPVVKSYVFLTLDKIFFFVDPDKITENITRHLGAELCITEKCRNIHPYENVWSDLGSYSHFKKLVGIILPGAGQKSASYAIFQTIPEKKRLLLRDSIIGNMKARKNPTERKGMERAHIRDSAILCDFFAHFEEEFKRGEEFDELKLAKELDSFRYELFEHKFKSTSFPTIVGFGHHGASPHYEPKNTTALRITDESTIVIDSGGQYLDGTTDITRTIHLGTPTAEQKEMYTRVLIGQINLASLVFPANMLMNEADIMARHSIWNLGLDYMHGTGHGVGAFLYVHEDPISVYYRSKRGLRFKEGYFFSNEPGYYKEGDFGIRLENIMETVVDKTKKKHPTGQPFLKFKDITFVPYETKLMDSALLTAPYRQWLNEYNHKIRHLVGPELTKQFRMKGFYWMMEKTKYIPLDGPISGSHSIFSLSIISFSIKCSLLVIFRMYFL